MEPTAIDSVLFEWYRIIDLSNRYSRLCMQTLVEKKLKNILYFCSKFYILHFSSSSRQQKKWKIQNHLS